jgi:hypothetical protein
MTLLGEPTRIGPYLAWRPAREGVLERHLGVRADDDTRTAVDVLTGWGSAPAPLRGPHPSLPPILSQGQRADGQRWWAREHTGGVPLVRLLARTSVQQAAVDVEMACWLVETLGAAALAAQEEPAWASVGHVVVRFDDGRPILLRDKPRYDDDLAALEWRGADRNRAQALSSLLAMCLDARAPVADAILRGPLPEAVQHAALAPARDGLDLVEALAAARTSDPAALQAAWRGAVHALFPDELAEHRALLEELGVR